jgi:chloride channel protein, CIC family
LALLVGAGAGTGAVVFRYLIFGFTEVFTGREDYGYAGRVASPHFPGLGIFFVILVPVLGGWCMGRSWSGTRRRPGGTGCRR